MVHSISLMITMNAHDSDLRIKNWPEGKPAEKKSPGKMEKRNARNSQHFSGGMRGLF